MPTMRVLDRPRSIPMAGRTNFRVLLVGDGGQDAVNGQRAVVANCRLRVSLYETGFIFC